MPQIAHQSGRDRAEHSRRTGKIYMDGEHATITAELAPAPADVAEALGIETGAQAIRRHRVTFNEDGTIESASTSWYDAAHADVAPLLLSNERIPEGSWAYLEKRTARKAVRGSETVKARMATDADVADFGLTLPAAVKEATLILRDAGGRVVEYGVSVAVEDREARYEFDLPA